jgi:hypothetical protein
VFAGNPWIKATLKKIFKPEYNEAILELEAQKKILHLCSAHWKADQMIGQALLQQGDTETKATKPPFPTPSSLSNTSSLPSELHAAFTQQVLNVTSINAVKCTLELSPGPNCVWQQFLCGARAIRAMLLVNIRLEQYT